jgi:dTDP-4-amino-4,6-dideoxygalactose transaminase
MFILERRASVILYNFLRSLGNSNLFLIPANVCPVVPIVFLSAGIRFKILDIDSSTLCLDLNRASAAITEDKLLVSGILYVRTYGSVTVEQNDCLADFRSKHPDLIIIDDRCLARPQLCKTGPVSDLELYSTGYAKYLDLGHGGFGFLSDSFDYQRFAQEGVACEERTVMSSFLKCIENGESFSYAECRWLHTEPYHISHDDYKSLLDMRLASADKHKNMLNTIYESRLRGILCLKSIFNDWRYNLLIANRDNVLGSIRSSGLFASSHYQSLARPFNYRDEDFPVAAFLGKHVLNLFNDKYFTETQAARITSIIKGKSNTNLPSSRYTPHLPFRR